MSEPAKKFDQSPESYSPKAKPEILRMAAEQSTPREGLAENVLRGIPRMGYGNPSPVCYIGSVRRLMEYLGDPIEEDELFALSGAGLCFPWQVRSCCDEVSILPEIPRRTFAALGYESEYFYEPDISVASRLYSKGFYMEKIMRSIDAGRPVVGFGFTAEVFACLITGYYNHGEGLYMRAYWSPKGTPEGCDGRQYYSVDDWYDKCHGIVVVGEKTGERLAGEKAYAHIRESAKIFSRMTSIEAADGWINTEPDKGGLQTVHTGFAAFDAMIDWLMDDTHWDDPRSNEGFLKPTGILLLQYYRDHLRLYLEKLSARCPGLVHPAIVPAINRMGEMVSGRERSNWLLGKAVDRRLKKFSNMRRRELRAKVAARVAQLKALDREIFDALLDYSPRTKPELLHMAEASQNRPTPVPQLEAFIASGGEPPRSKRIRKLRRLWHDLKCENFYLEGCFAAVLQAAGDAPKAREKPPTRDTKKFPLAFSYTFLMTVSGTLFTQTWPSPTSSAGMSSELGHSVMPHMFRQLGWSYLYMDRETIVRHPELAMRAVKASVKRGIPVMSRGIGNVQLKERYFECLPEWCLIGGYEKDGRLLVNVYPEDAETDKHGYIAVENGLAGSDGLYILGEKQREIDMARLYKDALRAIPGLVTMPAYNGVSFGRQAYYDWADALLDDANFTQQSDSLCEGFLWHGHMAPWIVALTNECYIRRFFDQVIAESGMPEAVKVKEIYTRIHADVIKIQELHGGDFDAKPEVVARREVREELAAIIRRMGDLHGELLNLFDYSPKAKPVIVSLAQAAQNDIFPCDTIEDPFAGGDPPRVSNRITEYRKIHPWENYFLASALCSVGRALGSEIDSLHFYSAITGDMFTYLYSTKREYCDSGVTSCFFMPQVVKKAYAAMGYGCVYLSTEYIKDNFRTVMNAIKASIDKGIPVLAWGMGNVTSLNGGFCDPMPEGCLIGGYDENDLLYVNLYCGPDRVETDDDGYTAIMGGLDTTLGLFFVGEPIAKTPAREVYREALASIPALLTLPPKDGFVFGQTAFVTWADTLLDESNFAGKTDEEIEGLGVTWDIHCAPYCTVCTSDALHFIKTAAKEHGIPAAKKLLPLYRKFTKRRQKIWKLQGGFEPPVKKFRQRKFREKIAKRLREMGVLCGKIAATT